MDDDPDGSLRLDEASPSAERYRATYCTHSGRRERRCDRQHSLESAEPAVEAHHGARSSAPEGTDIVRDRLRRRGLRIARFDRPQRHSGPRHHGRRCAGRAACRGRQRRDGASLLAWERRHWSELSDGFSRLPSHRRDAHDESPLAGRGAAPVDHHVAHCRSSLRSR